MSNISTTDIISTVASVILYRICSEIAYAERGYFAIGGEVFALALPIIVHAAVASWKKRKHREGKDGKAK